MKFSFPTWIGAFWSKEFLYSNILYMVVLLLHAELLPVGHLKSLTGVDFKIKLFTIGGKTLKLTIWDTGMCFSSYLITFSFIFLLRNFSTYMHSGSVIRNKEQNSVWLLNILFNRFLLFFISSGLFNDLKQVKEPCKVRYGDLGKC